MKINVLEQHHRTNCNKGATTILYFRLHLNFGQEYIHQQLGVRTLATFEAVTLGREVSRFYLCSDNNILMVVQLYLFWGRDLDVLEY